MTRILLAEDDKNLNRSIAEQLTENGFYVDCCFDGEDGNIDNYIYFMPPFLMRKRNFV